MYNILTKFSKSICKNKSQVRCTFPQVNFTVRMLSKATEEKEPTETEMYSIQGDDDLESRLEEKEAEIQKKRNKSMLWPQHQNILNGKVPYDEPKCETHLSLRYKKRMFGRYGHESGVDPGTLWPSLEEIKERYEYERVAYPYTVQEMWVRAKERRDNEEKVIQERQTRIANNLKKLADWKKEVADKSAKRLKEASDAKAKKEALIEEVRRHFGFKVDPKEERFKEMLAQKEKDQKKRLKAEKIKAKQEKLLIMEKSECSGEKL